MQSPESQDAPSPQSEVLVHVDVISAQLGYFFFLTLHTHLPEIQTAPSPQSEFLEHVDGMSSQFGYFFVSSSHLHPPESQDAPLPQSESVVHSDTSGVQTPSFDMYPSLHWHLYPLPTFNKIV